MIQVRSVCLSAHLDSFCRRLNELSNGDFEFVYQTGDPGESRRRIGWRIDADYRNGLIDAAATNRSRDCDLLIEMLRELDLMEDRACAGRKTVYVSERWFKPIPLFDLRLFGCLFLVRLPGVVRLLVPSYRKMAKRFVKLMDDPNFFVCPIGVHAVRDMVRMYRILHGDWMSYVREPKVESERQLCGSVIGFPRMFLWAYFVEQSKSPVAQAPKHHESFLRILWVGRMLGLKRADTLIKAFKIVAQQRPAALLIVGEGPERTRLEQLAGSLKELNQSNDSQQRPTWSLGRIVFCDFIKNDQVRELMRAADVFVMTSNAEEGWCAVVSEALTEGCPVVGTREVGSVATLLPDENLFASGDSEGLSEILRAFSGDMVKYSPEEWSGARAAQELLQKVKA